MKTEPFYARRLPTAEVGAARMDYPSFHTGRESAAIAEFGRAFAGTGDIAMKRLDAIVQSEYTKGKADYSTALLAFQNQISKDPNSDTYVAQFDKFFNKAEKGIIKGKSQAASRALTDLFKSERLSIKEQVKEFAWKRKRNSLWADTKLAVRKEEITGNAAAAEAALIEAMQRDPDREPEAKALLANVRANVDWYEGLGLVNKDPAEYIKMAIVDADESKDFNFLVNLDPEQKLRLLNTARSSQARIMKTRQSEYDQYVEQIEQDWLVKLRDNKLTENDIMSSTLEVDKKQEWLGYIDKQAEEILAGEDIVTNEVVKGNLEGMAYDIFTGAISLPDFQKELKKARYIDKAIDDAAYDEIFSLAQREYKSYQAQALKTATDDAARQLIDVKTELDLFAVLEAARARFKGESLAKETQRILSDRQLQYWNHSRYRKALNDWFAKNPDATAGEIYIEAQKLLVHYRGRTIPEIKTLLGEQEKRLQTAYPKTSKEMREVAKRPGFLGRKEVEFPVGFGTPKTPRTLKEFDSRFPAPKTNYERPAYLRLKSIWLDLPEEIQDKVTAALRVVGYTAIIGTDDLKPYLEKK